MLGTLLAGVITAVVWVLGVLLFLLPTLIAFNRQTPYRWWVLFINLVFGASFIGWIVALVLARRHPRTATA
ncbi:superinfection immunity protein [Streptomyces sp. 12297]|uniref:superinfection immunity protein n=1 Tax=Streptomyces sp. NBC_00239 TaxID=2903640 RepID=UPI002E28F471|nr:superinfection immunity protein [Streptomyces sp. NBC_00239]